jgi:hypothetical protein
MMTSPSYDFVSTSERMNIWMFAGCFIVAILCMLPEIAIGPSEINSWLGLHAQLSMIALCSLWIITQAMLLICGKVLESRTRVVEA